MPSGSTREIWFPAKRYGWGWGPPVRWQGWVFLLGWMATFFAGVVWLFPGKALAHWVFMTAMVAVLLAVCYAKGERPGWRWGEKK